MKPKISVWAAKTWKTAGKCENVLEDYNGNYCVLGAANKARYGDAMPLKVLSWECLWQGTPARIYKLIDYNNRPNTTKKQVLAYASRLGL